jgi:hypothetical protein
VFRRWAPFFPQIHTTQWQGWGRVRRWVNGLKSCCTLSKKKNVLIINKKKMSSPYHSCARNTGKCVGLKKGIEGYHKCARDSNCKKAERKKVDNLKERMRESKAKRVVKKRVQKKKFMSALRKPVQPPKKKRRARATPQGNKITNYF